MMKQLVCILVFAAAAWAQNVHRGTYFSASVGVSYLNSELNIYNFGYQSGVGSYTLDGRYEERAYYAENNKQERFSGFGFPSFDFRIGRSIANIVSLYTSFGGGLHYGEGRLSKQDYSVHRLYSGGILDQENKEVLGASDDKYDVYGFYVSLGLGFVVYPFRNPASPLYGFYLGVAGGIDASLSRIDELDEDHCGLMGIFTRYELGKDWWVSETWSVGVGFSWTKMVYENVNDGDDGNRHVISLFFRITRG